MLEGALDVCPLNLKKQTSGSFPPRYLQYQQENRRSYGCQNLKKQCIGAPPALKQKSDCTDSDAESKGTYEVTC